jgi:cytochrome c biogenesis protein CcdA/thiol-disulfide isomerase/thioredoxin
MILLLLAYVGGVLTIASPCILPVLPFVFARADRPFATSGLPLLLSMVATFALVATLASVVGGWAVTANQVGRGAALVLLAFFGLALLVPSLADWATRPLVAIGVRIAESAGGAGRRPGVVSSVALGVATGLLWAPCAGPVLGLILTGAALRGASAGTTVLLLAYAAGAATSLALALLVGGRVFAAMKRNLGVSEWGRRALGAAVLVAVAGIAAGVDTGFLTRVSAAGTAAVEQRLLERFHAAGPPAVPADGSMAMTGGAMMSAADQGPAMMAGSGMMMSAHGSGGAPELAAEGPMPPLGGATGWLNSSPLAAADLRGKVVLVDFWTYSCINCLRAIPYVKAWARKYASQGLVVVGVHAPEFAFEKDVGNVRRAVHDLGITYPVAIDSDYAIWRAFGNQYWPAHYFIDAKGQVRHHHFGEGDYEGSERVIQQLLAEAGHVAADSAPVTVAAQGVEAPLDAVDVGSPETYIGYERAENFASAGGTVKDIRHVYAVEAPLRLNDWALTGEWTVGAERAALEQPGGGVVYRFHARDLHLVLGPGTAGKPVRFQVTIDGRPPADDHGVDTTPDGTGTVREERLYQLIRQSGPVVDRTFTIRFLDAGVRAYAFTFG